DFMSSTSSFIFTIFDVNNEMSRNKTNENESIAILPKKNHKSAEDQKTFELKHGELEVPLSVQKTVYIPEFSTFYTPVIVSDAIYSKVLNIQQESILRDYTIYGFIIKNWPETTEVYM
ncbi:hypothetical protein N3930_26395, partial [Bacillus thuringiensis]|nr:hypothetical protein [Bacillus thuringiensis]